MAFGTSPRVIERLAHPHEDEVPEGRAAALGESARAIRTWSTISPAASWRSSPSRPVRQNEQAPGAADLARDAERGAGGPWDQHRLDERAVARARTSRSVSSCAGARSAISGDGAGSSASNASCAQAPTPRAASARVQAGAATGAPGSAPKAWPAPPCRRPRAGRRRAAGPAEQLRERSRVVVGEPRAPTWDTRAPPDQRAPCDLGRRVARRARATPSLRGSPERACAPASTPAAAPRGQRHRARRGRLTRTAAGWTARRALRPADPAPRVRRMDARRALRLSPGAAPPTQVIASLSIACRSPPERQARTRPAPPSDTKPGRRLGAIRWPICGQACGLSNRARERDCGLQIGFRRREFSARKLGGARRATGARNQQQNRLHRCRRRVRAPGWLRLAPGPGRLPPRDQCRTGN